MSKTLRQVPTAEEGRLKDSGRKRWQNKFSLLSLKLSIQIRFALLIELKKK